MYNYQKVKEEITSKPEFFKTTTAIRDYIQSLPSKHFLMEDALNIPNVYVGNSWHAMAYVDFLKEQGYIIEISGEGVASQHRVFLKK